mmetsp:Transcript_68825/g.126400  ORF Transcript_68825/g.126400 Transcript_68825/m.126400 type:complete len:229 (-) Transcript_68825:75-761(-)
MWSLVTLWSQSGVTLHTSKQSGCGCRLCRLTARTCGGRFRRCDSASRRWAWPRSRSGGSSSRLRTRVCMRALWRTSSSEKPLPGRRRRLRRSDELPACPRSCLLGLGLPGQAPELALLRQPPLRRLCSRCLRAWCQGKVSTSAKLTRRQTFDSETTSYEGSWIECSEVLGSCAWMLAPQRLAKIWALLLVTKPQVRVPRLKGQPPQWSADPVPVLPPMHQHRATECKT